MYYQRFAKTGNRKKERRYGISNDSDKVLGLVRKQYVEAALKGVKKDISLVEKALVKYTPIDEHSVMGAFVAKYPQLYEGLFYNTIRRDEWEKSFTPKEDFYVDGLKSVSLKGVDMRSGGEIYITSRLDHFGIPHRYEAPLDIIDIDGYAPDFTILRPRDNKIIYWEHFGKVNDEDYVMWNIQKVTNYIQHDIVPWDNLIMTYNNKKGGFDARIIDAMIEAWLL